MLFVGLFVGDAEGPGVGKAVGPGVGSGVGLNSKSLRAFNREPKYLSNCKSKRRRQ